MAPVLGTIEVLNVLAYSKCVANFASTNRLHTLNLAIISFEALDRNEIQLIRAGKHFSSG